MVEIELFPLPLLFYFFIIYDRFNIERYLRFWAIILQLGVFLFLFIYFPPQSAKIIVIQDYLISSGGIISAFIITYLGAKIFSIKTDREARQMKIDALSRPLTAFRKLVYFVIKSRNFWVDFSQITRYKNEYNLNYHELYEMRETEEPSPKDIKREKFYQDKSISTSRILLYLALEELYGLSHTSIPSFPYDKISEVRYTTDDLDRYYYPSNHIWVALSHKLHEQGHLFNENGVSVAFRDDIKALLPQIDESLKGKQFNFSIFSQIGGSIIHEDILPRMYKLIEENTGVPKGLLNTFYNLLIIMLFGVTIPLVLASIEIEEKPSMIGTLGCVLVTCLALTNFLFEFYYLFIDEIHLNRPYNH